MTARDSLEDGRSFLATMLGCPVALTNDPPAFLPGFEAAHCFIPDLQPALTAAWLAEFLSRADRRVVYELAEPLGTMVTLCWSGDNLVVVGPYTARALQPGDAEALLGSLRVPGVNLQAYTLYRARFAIVDSEYVMRGATR